MSRDAPSRRLRTFIAALFFCVVAQALSNVCSTGSWKTRESVLSMGNPRTFRAGAKAVSNPFRPEVLVYGGTNSLNLGSMFEFIAKDGYIFSFHNGTLLLIL